MATEGFHHFFTLRLIKVLNALLMAILYYQQYFFTFPAKRTVAIYDINKGVRAGQAGADDQRKAGAGR